MIKRYILITFTFEHAIFMEVDSHILILAVCDLNIILKVGTFDPTKKQALLLTFSEPINDMFRLVFAQLTCLAKTHIVYSYLDIFTSRVFI